MKQNKCRSFSISSSAGQKTMFHGWPVAIILRFCKGVTLTYGYVTVDNESGEAATAYQRTHYGALNLIWQPFPYKNLSLGLEGLDGVNEVRGGATGDDWRLQSGLVYSLFLEATLNNR